MRDQAGASPTEDASGGSYCVVGNDIDRLIEDAIGYFNPQIEEAD